MEEKGPDFQVDANGNESPEHKDEHHYLHVDERTKAEARRGSKINEATDIFGDVQTAEEYGYVARG